MLVIQKLHETKRSIEQRISENKKVLANGKTKLTVYFRAFQEEKELNKKLEQVEFELRQIIM